MSLQARVVVIGLDSASRNLLLTRIEAGDMPHLGTLLKQGCHGFLETPPALGDDAIWAGFYTACNPGKHGRYFYRQLTTGSYQMHKFQDPELKRPPFWELLSEQGYRAAVIDVPKSPLTANLNGIQLADWLVHGRDHKTCSWPSELTTHVLSTYGDDRTDNVHNRDLLCVETSLSESMLDTFLDRLEDGIHWKTEFAVEQLKQGRWDLFLTVFKESHCCLHQCWHLIEPDHPRFDQRHASRIQHRIYRIFSALDTAVGRIIEAAGPDANIICFSNLDIGPNFTANHLLDDILIRLEEPFWLRLWLPLFRISERWTKGRLQKIFRGIHQRLRRFRRVFTLEHNEMAGAIRLNLRGRELHGKIRDGIEADTLCDRLIDELSALVNPDTGERIVDQVIRTRDVFTGEAVDALPDLLVVWRRTQTITSAWSPGLGRIELPLLDCRTGNHIPGGIFFAKGPDLLSSADAVNGSILDLAPTVAKLLGADLPHVDGISLPIVRDPK